MTRDEAARILGVAADAEVHAVDAAFEKRDQGLLLPIHGPATVPAAGK